MKKLNFKKRINGVETAINLIPESYKTDKKEFIMSDGIETYQVRWEGTLDEGKAIVLSSKNDKMISEDIDKMKHLMGFKSEDTLGVQKGMNRIDENTEFNNMVGKVKNLTENKKK